MISIAMRGAFFVLVGSFGLGCGAPARHATTQTTEAQLWSATASSSPPSSSAPPPALRVHVALPHTPDAPHATLVVGYYTRDEWQSLESGTSLRPIASFVSRAIARPVDIAASSAPVDIAFEVPPGEYLVAGFVDTRGDLFHAMLGSGAGTFFAAQSATVDATGRAAIELALRRAPVEEPHPCEGERVEAIELDAPEIAGTLGNDTHRRLCVILPASYASQPRRRYPVVYWYPGLMGDDTTPLGVRTVLDHAMAQTGREAIVVGVDTRTNVGSSYLTDSPRVGQWDHFSTVTVPRAIDTRFRTIATSAARAIAGHSTGGFNALSLAMHHPDVFGTVGASSPDALDIATWMLDDDGAHVRPLWLAWTRLEDTLGGAGQLLSYANEWSPDDHSHNGVRWPMDLATGVLDRDVWARWLAQSPITWLDDPQGLARARRLATRIYITSGREDDFDLFRPAERFDAALTSHGIDHVFAPTPFGHIGHRDERFGPLATFVLRSMTPAR